MPANSLSRRLGEHIVREKEAHDLSRNAEVAGFPFFGYQMTAAALELVALCDADDLTERDIVRMRDAFFGLVRELPHELGLKPRHRNPNGLLGFVFARGCPRPLARFIARQTRISHAAGTGGLVVSWAIDAAAGCIHTHDNPVSCFPPVVVAARTVYPGLEYLQSLLPTVQAEPHAPDPPPATNDPPPDTRAPEHRPDAEPAPEYDAFISYAREDLAVALPLAQALNASGVRVWLDEMVLEIGDSRRQSTDHGLASSRFGIVVVSPSFMRNPLPQRELDGLTAREMGERRTVVLPIWHGVTAGDVRAWSPPLADKVALDTSAGIPVVADKIARYFHSLPASPGRTPAVPAAAEERGPGAGRIHILFLAADPSRSGLDLERELERIQTHLRLAKERDRLHLKAVLAGSFDRLSQAMLDDAPTIVHFAGHGRPEGLILRGEMGEPHVVPIAALAGLFELFKGTVQCVVLNACWSQEQACAIRQHIPHVIGMRERIPDATAIAFSTGFYQAIAAGEDVPFAYRMGVLHARNRGESGDDLITLL